MTWVVTPKISAEVSDTGQDEAERSSQWIQAPPRGRARGAGKQAKWSTSTGRKWTRLPDHLRRSVSAKSTTEQVMGRTVLVTALAPAAWGTTYIVSTELMPAGRPLLTATLRVLPIGIRLVARGRTASGPRDRADARPRGELPRAPQPRRRHHPRMACPGPVPRPAAARWCRARRCCRHRPAAPAQAAAVSAAAQPVRRPARHDPPPAGRPRPGRPAAGSTTPGAPTMIRPSLSASTVQGSGSPRSTTAGRRQVGRAQRPVASRVQVAETSPATATYEWRTVNPRCSPEAPSRPSPPCSPAAAPPAPALTDDPGRGYVADLTPCSRSSPCD
ncbi:hypothetical protein BH23ACT9_BH23ACT9_39980 [soil metagenome]